MLRIAAKAGPQNIVQQKSFFFNTSHKLTILIHIFQHSRVLSKWSLINQNIIKFMQN